MPNTDSLYRVATEERYRVLRHALVIARSRPDWGLRLDQTAAIRAELRALVRVRWFVRRQRIAERQQTTVDYHTWQAAGPISEHDLFDGYGVDRESQPEFNGAFSRW